LKKIHRSAFVMYSAAEMYALVADVPSYPTFLPWCGGAHLVNEAPGIIEAAITIAYRGVNKTFVTRNRLLSNESIDMELVEGPFRHLRGLWRFTPLDERACKIEFELEFEAANRVVGAVLNPVFNNIANHMVDAFHSRAIELYGKR
jgi:ribosome-associated toxin RatA of RatAB toxin-antitoxin module